MAKIKNILIFLLRIGLSFLFLFLLFKFNKINTGDLIDVIKNSDKSFLLLGFGIFASVHVLGFLRWKILLEACGINVEVRRLVTSFCGGIFFSIFLPSTIGGDLVRSMDLAGHTKKTEEVVATVFLDRLSGYIGLVMVVLPSIYLGRKLVLDKVVFSSVSMIVAILICILLVLFNKTIYSVITKLLSSPGAGKIREMIKGMHQEIHIFRHRKKIVVLSLLLSLFIQLLVPISGYLIGYSLGLRIPFIYYFVFLPIISAIILLPIALGGLGLREGLFVLYFAKAGVMKPLALAMSLLSFSFVVLYGAIAGLIYALTLQNKRAQSKYS